MDAVARLRPQRQGRDLSFSCFFVLSVEWSGVEWSGVEWSGVEWASNAIYLCQTM
ncbi:hypothetical protein BN938_1304 [Mucinivorans hirudinis]|uniref:Uncharacterized protein n=1 Tax=Mucinivorans hirudinis TaxID=1433126 RepID=A0A060RC93_9BACT|nr:hypothetical protein BN938_1304 [Mucinivorans hirudinis]